jgi:putative hydrolase
VIDLHTHSIFSDGELIPAELAQRAFAAGYKALAITDHVDHSNIDFILPRIIKVCSKITEEGKIKVFPGVEIHACRSAQIAGMADEARKLGAKIVLYTGKQLLSLFPPAQIWRRLNQP